MRVKNALLWIQLIFTCIEYYEDLGCVEVIQAHCPFNNFIGRFLFCFLGFFLGLTLASTRQVLMALTLQERFIPQLNLFLDPEVDDEVFSILV